MVSTADRQRRWQIKGVSAKGNKIAFPVSGYEYSDAKKAAEAKLKPGDRIDSIVLLEPRKSRFI